MSAPGLYVHFPFCRRKCHYCDFNSCVASPRQREAYLHALECEINRHPSCHVGTVYFGGGTPTLYPPDQLAAVLLQVRHTFTVAPDAEITVEANPGTVSTSDLRALRQAGFNRLSLGVQSLRDDELSLLGRVHTADDARQTARGAREAGVGNLSLDLIRSLPGQTLEAWEETLEAAIALAPNHISVYGLSLEPGTPLHHQVECGRVPAPREDQAPEWIARTVRRLEHAGYGRYEIANYAQPGFECRHNVNYWRNGEYLGLGAGAWSYLAGERERNVADPARYTQAALAGDELTAESERLQGEAALGEAVMIGLRMVEGISRREIIDTFGIDIYERHHQLIARLCSAGLVADDPERLRLTFQGMLVQSAIALEFMP